MSSNKSDVYIYGAGSFFEHHKHNVFSLFNVLGIIDKNKSETNVDGVKVVHDFQEYKLQENQAVKLLLMVEKPHLLFEILSEFRANNINGNNVLLGISFFGVLSKYYSFYLSEKMELSVAQNGGNSIFQVSDEHNYINLLKENTKQIVSQRGEAYKTALRELYKDEINIMWMDNRLWCADHDADLYYRFFDSGFFNWGYALMYSLVVINKFNSPEVLDIACGDAYWYRNVYKNIEGLKYTGCDINDGFIRKETGLCNCIEPSYEKCDIREKIPYPRFKKFFDVILWMESYCVFTDDDHIKIIRDAKERLGEKGIFFVCDYFSTKQQSPWIYSINSANNKDKLYAEFKKEFKNISIFIDEKAEFFCLFASDGDIPVWFSPSEKGV